MARLRAVERLKQWWQSLAQDENGDDEGYGIARYDSFKADDPVDESSMESFPSSDPPAWTPTRGISAPERPTTPL